MDEDYTRKGFLFMSIDRTLVILKPDAVERQVMGTIIARFEARGLKIVACKMMRVSESLARVHYAAHVDKPFFSKLLSHITAGPVLLLALQAPGVIDMVRTTMGSTFASDATPGTIRGDLGSAQGTFNLIHGSDSDASAARELALFFNDDEFMDYELPTAHWLRAERLDG
jgi:nucleoside-diphosphate kinase